jgi:hypothetical protein
MNRTPVGEPAAPRVWEGFWGVVFSPGELFERVARAPRWFAMLAVVTAIYIVSVSAFMFTDVGQDAWMEQALERTERFGGQVTDAQIERMEGMKPYAGYFAAGQMLFFIPLVSLAIAGIGFTVFNVALGGSASFRQVFSIVVHAGALGGLLQFFVWPLNYLRESMSSPTSLSVFLPMLEESTFLFRFLRAVDLLIVWWVVVLAIGLAVLYRRPAQRVAWSFLAIYAVIALAIAAVSRS